jgi:hypothetical protein
MMMLDDKVMIGLEIVSVNKSFDEWTFYLDGGL